MYVSSSPAPFDALPEALLPSILVHLPADQARSARASCRRWRDCIDVETTFWRAACVSRRDWIEPYLDPDAGQPLRASHRSDAVRAALQAALGGLSADRSRQARTACRTWCDDIYVAPFPVHSAATAPGARLELAAAAARERRPRPLDRARLLLGMALDGICEQAQRRTQAAQLQSAGALRPLLAPFVEAVRLGAVASVAPCFMAISAPVTLEIGLRHGYETGRRAGLGEANLVRMVLLLVLPATMVLTSAWYASLAAFELGWAFGNGFFGAPRVWRNRRAYSAFIADDAARISASAQALVAAAQATPALAQPVPRPALAPQNDAAMLEHCARRLAEVAWPERLILNPVPALD